MIGASGGIAGILGAYLLLHPKAAVRCFLLIIVFIRFINLPAWLVLGVWIGGQFVAVPEALAHTDGGGVAYMAHIGGFLAGMILIPFSRNAMFRCSTTDQPPKTWSGAPISFSDLKAQARTGKFHRRAHANKASQLARGSVPSRPEPDQRSGAVGLAARHRTIIIYNCCRRATGAHLGLDGCRCIFNRRFVKTADNNGGAKLAGLKPWITANTDPIKPGLNIG